MRYILPALVTPFDSEGNLAEQVLRDLVRWNLKKGVSGFYVNGSTGEFLNLSIAERKRMLEIVFEEADENSLIISQVASPRFSETLELAEHAKSVGVDMISVVPPLYFPYREEEIRGYFTQIAHTVKLPLLIYHVPNLSHTSLNRAFFSSLLEDSLIAGVKFTSYDLYSLTLLRSDYPDKILFMGHDELFLPALTINIDGAIGSTFNIMADKFVAIRELYTAHRMQDAYELQAKVSYIVNVLLEEGIFPSIKYLLQRLGFACGTCRKPFMELSSAAMKRLDDEVLVHL